MIGFLLGLIAILLCFSFAGVAVTSRYKRDMNAIREHIDGLGSLVVETDWGQIEYARVGGGYPVLVVHGNAGGFDQGLLMANKTVDTEFQIIAVSRFGYLRSTLPSNAGPSMQADAFARLLDSLNIKKAAVIAYSAGSASSLQLAMRHPDRVSALILVSPVGLGKGPVMSKLVFDALFRRDLVYWATITYFGSIVQPAWAGVPKGFTLTPEETADVRSVLTGILPVSARVNGSFFDTYVSTPQMLNSSENSDYPYGGIKAPTLVISAIDDPLALHENAHALADRIPSAHLMNVPDGGHMLLGHYEEVRSEITRFIHGIAALQNDSQ